MVNIDLSFFSQDQYKDIQNHVKHAKQAQGSASKGITDINIIIYKSYALCCKKYYIYHKSSVRSLYEQKN